VQFDFDPEKDAANRTKHGLGLSQFPGFDPGTDLTIADVRQDFGEPRYRSFGRVDGIGYMIAFTVREDRIRLISFRRAHEKEMQRYER
jgi:uncharacterized protein